jgi:glycosyltransferase involved in cell wall biosynthesis
MKFSIIIPTYNRAGFVGKTISSLLSQTYHDFELIVVDDGSTDNTGELIAAIKDPRIRYYKKNNAERGAARNYGAALATGEWLNFFDSDDIAYDNHLQTASDFIKRAGRPEIFHLNYDIKDPEGRVIIRKRNISNINRQITHGNLLSCNGVFNRKDIFDNYKFSEYRRLSGSEDYLLWLQLSFDYKIHSVDAVTSTIIDHENRSVIRTDVDKLIERKNLLLGKLHESCKSSAYYRKSRNVISCNNYLYVSLHLALLKNRRSSLSYWYKAVRFYPSSLFSRKTLVIIKKIIF